MTFLHLWGESWRVINPKQDSFIRSVKRNSFLVFLKSHFNNAATYYNNNNGFLFHSVYMLVVVVVRYK